MCCMASHIGRPSACRSMASRPVALRVLRIISMCSGFCSCSGTSGTKPACTTENRQGKRESVCAFVCVCVRACVRVSVCACVSVLCVCARFCHVLVALCSLSHFVVSTLTTRHQPLVRVRHVLLQIQRSAEARSQARTTIRLLESMVSCCGCRCGDGSDW